MVAARQMEKGVSVKYFLRSPNSGHQHLKPQLEGSRGRPVGQPTVVYWHAATS